MAQGTLPDLWTTRDLPVLRHIAELLEVRKEPLVEWPRVSVDLRMEGDDTRRSLLDLHGAGYLEGERLDGVAGMGHGHDGRNVIITGLTEKGRRGVGIWPSGDIVDALVEALQRAAETTDDPKKKRAIRKILEAVPGVGRDLLTNVMGNVITAPITG